ncbi:hypothetical protein ABT214_00200, partial [Micromonospora purpureochromogenes]|uniref:hypothetical protein n=1 Tax=Micromonospora purpureochromogenes TaxID=47872 RepID=UPI003316A863
RAGEPAGEPGPIASVTRELPLVAGRDLPDLVDTAASRTTPPVATPDAVEAATGQRSASRPRQRPVGRRGPATGLGDRPASVEHPVG